MVVASFAFHVIVPVSHQSNGCKPKKTTTKAAFLVQLSGEFRDGHHRRDPLTENAYQVQVIWPPAEDAQVLVVSECDAAADQVAGGPVTAVAVTVTFCEGRKP
jgi:hypothetical protein